jgi:MOB kinase activator 1
MVVLLLRITGVGRNRYVDYLMTWIQVQLDDQELFPSKIGVPFPARFHKIAKTMQKRLFRVYAHIYHSHFEEVSLCT